MDEVVDAWVSDTAYAGQRELWVDLPTWRRMGENRPQRLERRRRDDPLCGH